MKYTDIDYDLLHPDELDRVNETIDLSIYIGTFTSTPQFEWSENSFESTIRSYHNV